MNFAFIWYENVGGTFVRFVTIHARDGQTDGQTDTFAIAKTALRTMQRGKNAWTDVHQIRCEHCQIIATHQVLKR